MTGRFKNYLGFGVKLGFLLLVVGWGVARAEVYITVTGANIKRAKLALGKLHPLPDARVQDKQLAAKIYKQVRDDMDFMNLFDFVAPELFATTDNRGDLYKIRYADWSVLQASFLLKLGYKMERGKLVIEALFYDIPGEKKIFGTRYRYPAAQYARLVHALSEDVLKAVTGERGLFFSRVLMVCRTLRRIKNPPKDIYIADSDGKNFMALTADKTLSLSPSWAPRGKTISYTQYQYQGRGRKRMKVATLKMHDLRTGKRKVLSSKKGMNSGAAWSPDGKQVAATLSYTGRPEIYLFDPSKPNKPRPLSRKIQWRKISGTGFHRSSARTLFDVEPSWSPDGKQIVISSARTGHPMIYIVDLATKQAKQLTFAGTYNSSPAWSPRGDKIVFAAQRTGTGNFDLFVIDTDGTNLNRLTQGGWIKRKRVHYENPSWAPTGRHIAYSTNKSGHYEIYVSTLEGRVSRRISPPGKECTTPAWGPAEN